MEPIFFGFKRSSSGLLHTALHHLCERLHRRLFSAVKAALSQQGADHDLQGAAPGQVVVLCRA